MFLRDKVSLFAALLLLVLPIFTLPAEASAAALSGRVVVIDPGHGGSDPGGVNPELGLHEKYVNLAVARRLQRMLMDAGAMALLTHNDTETAELGATGLKLPYFSLRSRAALANTAAADAFISIHTNCFPNPHRRGTEVFYHPGSAKGALLAAAIQEQLAGIAGGEGCTYRGASYYVLNRTVMPAVLVELGYLTCASEAARLLDNAYQERLARAIFLGVSHYFEAAPAFANGDLRARHRAQLAIVIDDFAGATKNGTQAFFALGKPLTFAVMPNFPDSASIAQRATRQGYQVLVHLPMEPFKGKASHLGPGTIYVHLSDAEIEQRVHRAIASVPGAVGVNNHMGSRATSDARVMRAVLRAVKAHGMFFLDSRTTDRSVACEVAAELGVPCGKRDYFLDNVNNIGYIKEQLLEAARLAQKRGSAVAIGHVGTTGANTARAIREMIPELEARGIELVYLSNIIFQQQRSMTDER
ncbi:divergent polysaccharide deacetylase family protein [Thermodesulfitimonas autotrophica]|uniref:divergent polysaccharide deacetylase family protein n=1 Tax=Thermodesulfitimonas autotrophica TaxID=1894989 RepID=UPI002FDF6F83